MDDREAPTQEMELHILAFAKADLERLPSDEREAFLLFGHIANELAVLNKLHLWTSYSVQEAGIRGHAGITQALVMARLLAGKLREAWVAVDRAYFKSGLSRRYVGELSPAGQRSLDECRKYFGPKNRLHETRNSFSFHYSLTEIRRGFRQLDDQEDLRLYMAEDRGNNLYYASEVVVGTAQGTLLGASEVSEGLGPFLREITNIGSDLWTFLDQFIATVLRKHFGNPDEVLGAETIEGVPAIESIRIPYFTTLADADADT